MAGGGAGGKEFDGDVSPGQTFVHRDRLLKRLSMLTTGRFLSQTRGEEDDNDKQQAIAPIICYFPYKRPNRWIANGHAFIY
jgi:hypothetical protein